MYNFGMENKEITFKEFSDLMISEMSRNLGINSDAKNKTFECQKEVIDRHSAYRDRQREEEIQLKKLMSPCVKRMQEIFLLENNLDVKKIETREYDHFLFCDPVIHKDIKIEQHLIFVEDDGKKYFLE